MTWFHWPVTDSAHEYVISCHDWWRRCCGSAGRDRVKSCWALHWLESIDL